MSKTIHNFPVQLLPVKNGFQLPQGYKMSCNYGESLQGVFSFVYKIKPLFNPKFHISENLAWAYCRITLNIVEIDINFWQHRNVSFKTAKISKECTDGFQVVVPN